MLRHVFVCCDACAPEPMKVDSGVRLGPKSNRCDQPSKESMALRPLEDIMFVNIGQYPQVN